MHQEKIYGIGIDIVEVERIQEASRRWGTRFEHRIYTHQELTYCGDAPSRYWRLAARFAAKEATLKALGTGLTTGMRWQDVEIQTDVSGKPEIVLYGEVRVVLTNAISVLYSSQCPIQMCMLSHR